MHGKRHHRVGSICLSVSAGKLMAMCAFLSVDWSGQDGGGEGRVGKCPGTQVPVGTSSE